MASWDTDAGLAPLSPRPQNLDSMQPKAAVDAIVQWFHDNFEDPDRSTSYNGREGGYIYVWGPYTALEILEGNFEGLIEEDLIRFAAAEIEGDGTEWVPASSRILPPDDEEPPPPSTEELHAEMQRQIRDIQDQLAQLEGARAGIGHNRPPEPIDDEPLSKDDRRELADALTTLGNQPVVPADQGAAATEASSVIASKRGKVRTWLAGLGKGIATIAGTVAAEKIIEAIWVAVWPSVEKLLGIVAQWIASLPI